MARASKFKEEYTHQAEVACKEGGFTTPKLAKLFKVATSTVNKWMKDFPEFKAAVQRGKDHFDTVKVEKSLLKRALGYKYTEVTSEPVTAVVDGKIVTSNGVLVTKKVKKEIAPDTTAQIFFLKNRNPERWRDARNIDVSGGLDTGHKEEVDISKLSAEQLEALASIRPKDKE